MRKDAFYFPHDSNAKDDPKMVLMIEQLGLEAYGIYWVLIETLRDQPGYRYPIALLPALARRYVTTRDKVEAVVKGYTLFEIEDGEFFLSPSLCRRMEALDAKRRKLSEAGKRGRQKQLGPPPGQAQATPGHPPGKRREEKRRDKSIYGTFSNVLLTEKEKEKLDEKFGSAAEEKINNLSEYVASKGKKYKSHYATILNWSRRDTEKAPEAAWE